VTIVEPLPDLQWGKGTWQDYISNWRTRDTNWMQERLILRYQTTALRNSAWAAPGAGQVTYNDETKSLEMWRAAPTSAWVRSLMFQYLISSQDTAAGTNIFHASSGGKGITLGPTSLLIDSPTTNFLNGVHVVDATGMTVKVGTKTAKLSTDTANLVSDSPIKAPSLVSDGAISAVGAISAGSISSASATLTNIGMSGTLSGGVINGSSGTIGSIGHAAGVLSIGAGSASANAAGVQAGQGYFYGDTNSAVMRQRTTSASAAGAAYAQVTATDVVLSGTLVQLGNPRVLANAPLTYATTAGVKNGGPVIYGADPGVANVPEGTIWVS
jgi:hypothetical protein